jgi:nucleoside phosphorylase
MGENATGIIGRKSHITPSILSGWQAGPDTAHKIWLPINKILRPEQVDLVARIPFILDERGVAVTWSAIYPELPGEARAASPELRNALQHTYFKLYCSEFKLVVLTQIPHILQDFALPAEPSVYSYRRLEAFLDAFDLRSVILDGPADLIVELRRGKGGFIAFMDAYSGLARITKSETDLKFFAGAARRATKFDWSTIAGRRAHLFELSPFEVSELDDVLMEAAERLVEEHGLPLRTPEKPKPEQRGRKVATMLKSEPELVLFVALEEELNVLSKALKLTKNTTPPEATGLIGSVPVAVVCPRNMGRVAAAISMMEYLGGRKSKPKLIMIVGIAGGFKENNSIEGHIVCVDKVVDLALRKVIDEAESPASPNFRREDYRMNDSLSRVIQSDAFDDKEWSFEACGLGWPDDRRPSIKYGLMASADEVISSDTLRIRMLEGAGGEKKLLGIEMEAGGVCAAADRRRVPYCMLRVISDQADPSKTDNEWRKLGMETIAHLLVKLPLDEVLRLAA